MVAPNACRRGAILSGDLLVFDAEDSRQERISRHRAEGQRHAGTEKLRRSGSTWSKPMAASPAISWATKRRATIPKEFGEFKSSADAWQRRILSGQAMTSMLNADRPARREPRDRRCSAIGPTASPPANCPKPKPPRPQGVERNVVVTRVGLEQSQGLSARRDLDRQAQSDGQRQRPDLWLDGSEHGSRPGARPGAPQSVRDQTSRCAIRTRRRRRPIRWRRRLTGATSRSGTASRTSTIR